MPDFPKFSEKGFIGWDFVGFHWIGFCGISMDGICLEFIGWDFVVFLYYRLDTLDILSSEIF